MKYLASVVSLIFLPKTLIWNKITFQLSNLLNFPELVVNNELPAMDHDYLFQDGGRYHIKTSLLQNKSMEWFLYDNGLRHERVNHES